LVTDTRTDVDYAAVFAALPTPYVVLDRELVVIDANEAFLTATLRPRSDVVGHFLFGALPPSATGGKPAIQLAMEQVRDTGLAQTMPIQRYPIRAPDGTVSDRYWLIVGAPLRDAYGTVTAVLQRVEDVTSFVAGRSGRDVDPSEEEWRRRIDQVEADLFVHARQLASSQLAKDAAARQVARLAEVALALTSAASIEDLEEIVVGRGLAVLGADGGAVVSRAADGDWRITDNEALGPYVQGRYGLVPYDSPLPACWTARTGERLLLPTRPAGLAFHPVMAEVYADTRRAGWAFLPLTVQDQPLGALAVSWVEDHPFPPAELELLDGFAAQCAQALYRIQTAEAQRAAALRVQDLAEALQQALLTPPPEPDHLHVVVRYRTADDVARVGGDWYDAFMQPDGATVLVVGDVVGHDSVAAASMGQLRGLLRALAYSADDSARADAPAAILTRFEHAARGLSVEALATAILARIERVPDEPVSGVRRLRWSNAGHPSPALLEADGTVTILDRRPNLMLGVDPDAPRQDHTILLPDGATLVLYTDGLVERRDASFDEGIEGLRAALTDLAGTPLDELCDTVLERLAPHTGEDDIALVAVRAYREDRPRPAEAGPNVTPADQPDR
jgi:serine phosphatase RsbU (regulator of sigma subunit)